jgi:L-threonylcarbamoyladenylate synthase
VRAVTADDPDAVRLAAAALRAGGAVVLPTETVQGLAALPSVPGATDRLFALKGRPADVALALLVADVDQAASVAVLDAAERRVVDACWPGPLTVVVWRRADVSLDLGGDPSTVGVRCPDHAFVRALAAVAGPLATTSANAHGRPTPASARDAAASLDGDVALVVDGGPCTGVPSTVVDLTGIAPRILRAGSFDLATVEALWAG